MNVSYGTVMPQFWPVLKMIATMTKSLKRVCPGGVPVYSGEAPIYARITRCHPGYPRFMPDHPPLSRSSPGVLSRFVSVSARFYPSLQRSIPFIPVYQTMLTGELN